MLPILGSLGSLFGSGDTSAASGAAAGPVSQSTGAISFGARYLGRGSVSSTDANASGGGSVVVPAASPAGDSTPFYAALALWFVGLVLVLATRKGGG